VVGAVVLSGKHAPPAPPDKGSAVAVQPTPVPTPVPQPPQPPPQPVLPAKVKLTIDTVPHGATVIDLATNMTFPTKTPITTSLPGQAAPRQYSITLKGYQTEIVNIALDKDDKVNFSEPLTKGTSSAPIVHDVKPATGSGSSVKPDQTPVTNPDVTPEIKPDVKPDVKPAADCSDDPASGKPLCTKNPFGSGS
jgi:hypothetical protein